MKLQQLLLNQAGTGPSASYQLVTHQGVDGRDECALQVLISATATVQVEARLHESLPWVVVDTISVSSIAIYGRFAQVRVNVTANTGAVSAFIGG